VPEAEPGPLRVDRRGDGVLVVTGDLDLEGRVILEAAVAEHDAASGLTIDLAGVEFVDSSGLRALLWANRRATEAGGDVVLRSPTPQLRRVLEITGTASLFIIDP
jgi:anti-sigma B factor antagonist